MKSEFQVDRSALPTDPKRDPSPDFRGFQHQIWQTVWHWITLRDDQALYLEAAEDFDLVGPGGGEANQVRDPQKPGTLTLRSSPVRAVINNYWKARRENAIKVSYRLLTTAKRGLERGRPFGTRRGLDVWDDVRRGGASSAELRDFLTRDMKFSAELREWAADCSNDDFRTELINEITWATKQPRLESIQNDIFRRLIDLGDEFGIPPSASESAAFDLYDEVCNLLDGAAPRCLQPTDFLRLFEHVTKVSSSGEFFEAGRVEHDDGILARSLHDKATLRTSDALEEARENLLESLRDKQRIGDVEGEIATFSDLGFVEVELGNHERARQLFWKSEKKSRRLDLHLLRSLARVNLGASSADLGKYRHALGHFTIAHKLGSKYDYQSVLVLATRGLAVMHVRLQEWAEAEQHFRDLSSLTRKSPDRSEFVAALHDEAVCAIQQEKYSCGSKLLSRALRNARLKGLETWIIACHKTSALCGATAPGDILRGVRRLADRADHEEREGNHRIAASLWETCGDSVMEVYPSSAEIGKYYKRALTEYTAGDIRDRNLFELLKKLYLVCGNRSPELSVVYTREIESLAKDIGTPEEKCTALDEKGRALQALGLMEEAEKAYRAAIELSRSLKNHVVQAGVHNKLAELLRETGRAEESLSHCLDSENLSREARDPEGELISAHHRALAHEQLGETDRAESLLIEIRDRSRKSNLHREYVRATLALASIAFVDGRRGLAFRRYRLVIDQAQHNNLYKVAVDAAISMARLKAELSDHGAGLGILEGLDIPRISSPLLALKRELAIFKKQAEDLKGSAVAYEQAAHVAVSLANGLAADHCILDLFMIALGAKEFMVLPAIERVMSTARKERVDLYGCRALLDLLSGKSARSELSLCKALEYYEEAGQIEHRRKLRIAAAEYYWASDPKMIYRALCYYVDAMGSCPAANDISMIGGMMMVRITTLHPDPGISRIRSLRARMEKYLMKDLADEKLVSMRLWPFEAAIEIVEQGTHVDKNPARTEEIAERTMRRAFALP